MVSHMRVAGCRVWQSHVVVISLHMPMSAGRDLPDLSGRSAGGQVQFVRQRAEEGFRTKSVCKFFARRLRKQTWRSGSYPMTPRLARMSHRGNHLSTSPNRSTCRRRWSEYGGTLEVSATSHESLHKAPSRCSTPGTSFAALRLGELGQRKRA